jgi:subtilisin
MDSYKTHIGLHKGIGEINNTLGKIVASFFILLIFSSMMLQGSLSGYFGNAFGQLDNKISDRNIDDRTAQSLDSGKKLREVSGEKVPNQYIVVLKDRNLPSTAVQSVAEEARNQGALVRHVYEHAIRGFAIRIPNDRVLDSILKNPEVDYVQPDVILKAFSQTLPTGINRVDGDLSSTKSGDGSGTVNVDIAILDTGIQLNHPDLNVYRDTTFVSGTTSGNDDDGHGTHVAGIAAAKDNTEGVVGMAPGARLWAVKVLDKNGNGFDSDIIAGIDYITQHANEIDVVNMSFGGPCCDTALHTAIANSVAAGVTYTAAAGNDGIDAGSEEPANYPEVITVSAISDTDGKCGAQGGSSDDRFASFSNYGSVVDMSAPGVNILSTYIGSSYATFTGTSMATPHVTGAAALYESLHTGATPSEVRNALLSSGSTPSTVCDGKGHGYFTGDPDGIAEPLLYVGTFGSGDTTPPTVTITDPANGAINVPLTKWTRATFSEPMLSSSITTSTFSLKVSGSSTNVPGVVWLNTESNSMNAYFAPSSNLSPGTTYVATVTTGVKDLAGNAMTTAKSWSFTTTSDTTPPTVTITDPANAATNVPLTKWARATFSEPMLSSSITTSTFSLKVSGSSTNIPGVVWLNTEANSMNAYFAPSSNLSPGTTYVATVTTGVKDLAGNAMTAAKSWSFTTTTSTSGANVATSASIINNNSSTSPSTSNYTSSSNYTSTHNHSDNHNLTGTRTDNEGANNQSLISPIQTGDQHRSVNTTSLEQQQQQVAEEQARLALQDAKRQQLDHNNENMDNKLQTDLTNTSREKLKPTDGQKEIPSTNGTTSASQEVVGSSESHPRHGSEKNLPIENKAPAVSSVSNHPPFARDDRLQTETNKPIVAAILDNDIDKDGDKLNIVSVSSPTVRGTVIINQNGTISYIPATDFAGLDTFTYTVSDNEGKTDVGKVLIIVKLEQDDNARQAPSPSIMKEPEGDLLQTQADEEKDRITTEGAQDSRNNKNNDEERRTSSSIIDNGSDNDKSH